MARRPSTQSKQEEYPHLANHGLEVHATLGDGNCFFRAISRHIYGSEEYHHQLRRDIVAYMRRNRSEFEAWLTPDRDWDVYLTTMETSGQDADEYVLAGAANMLRSELRLWYADGHFVPIFPNVVYGTTVYHFAHCNEEVRDDVVFRGHFDSVHPFTQQPVGDDGESATREPWVKESPHQGDNASKTRTLLAGGFQDSSRREQRLVGRRQSTSGRKPKGPFRGYFPVNLERERILGPDHRSQSAVLKGKNEKERKTRKRPGAVPCDLNESVDVNKRRKLDTHDFQVPEQSSRCLSPPGVDISPLRRLRAGGDVSSLYPGAPEISWTLPRPKPEIYVEGCNPDNLFLPQFLTDEDAAEGG